MSDVPPARQDTPRPGWESGVWLRIGRHRARRHALLLASGIVLVLCLGGLGAAARFRLPHSLPVRVEAHVLGTPRADGSAFPATMWRVEFEGAELRVYRNSFEVVHRCLPPSGCVRIPGGWETTVQLGTAGEYRAVAFSRTSTGNGTTLRGDVDAARARGEQVQISPTLVVY